MATNKQKRNSLRISTHLIVPLRSTLIDERSGTEGAPQLRKTIFQGHPLQATRNAPDIRA
jgi:hypothetical protein